MDELLRLMRQKIDWSQKFFNLTNQFLEYLRTSPDSAIIDLDYFLNNRQSLLDIIVSTEKRITQLLKSNKINQSILRASKEAFDACAKEQTEIYVQVAKIDEQLLKTLGKHRKESEEQLRAVTRGKKAISGYRQDPKSNSKLNVEL